MKINIKLDTRSTKAAIRNLRRYQKEFDAKCSLAVSKLIDEGISTAKLNCGEYGEYISFYKAISDSRGKVVGTLMAVGTPLQRLQNGEVVEANPVFLAEFGSGWNAKVLDKIEGATVGQGTFPNQRFAFDPRGWWYTDYDTGESVHSYGESPTFPMHSASIAMIYAIDKVLKEVFGNGKR